MRYSASMMSTWMRCPQQAKFKSVLKLPESQHAKTTYGTCVHEALELLNKTGDIEKAVARFKETWDDPTILDAEIDVWPQNLSWGSLNERGVSAIRRYHDDNKWETRKILASEHRFLVPFGKHTLSGIIDNLEITGAGANKELRIIDYKTSSYVPTFLELRSNTQFSCYFWATHQPEFWENIPDGEKLFESLKNTKRRGVWYSLWNHRTVDVGPRNDLDYERLYRVMLEIERALEADVYMPNLSAESCMYCSYIDLCAVTIPITQEVEIARRERIEGIRR